MKILIVDDDQNIRWVLEQYLAGKGFQTIMAETGELALTEWQRHSPEIILLDFRLPGKDGLEVLRQIRQTTDGSQPEVIIITSHGETRIVVEAMKLGAADFIDKPFDIEEIGIVIDKVLERKGLKEEIKILKKELRQENIFRDIVGDSLQINHIKNLINQVADVNATVLLAGESGTGKDMIARHIHLQSNRSHKEFVKINCAALPEHLLESELFGYEKGAFTGALKRKKGKFELADQGTIYLDEIGEMTPHLQAKLLQVLQDNTYSSLGSEKETTIDTRVVAATNIDIEKAIHNGKFRPDLYYRLNVIHIEVPPLRNHIEDIPLLVETFLLKYCQEYKRPLLTISPDYLEKLMNFNWPGNVRQLENVIKQFVIFQSESVFDRTLSVSGLPVTALPATAAPALAPPQPQKEPGLENLSLKEVTKDATMKAERELITQVLKQTDWNRTETAKILQISYKSLLNKIKEIGLDK